MTSACKLKPARLLILLGPNGAETTSFYMIVGLVLKEVIEVAPQYENAVHVTQYGWMRWRLPSSPSLTYIAGLMCSHLAAFRIATNLRLAMVKHIARTAGRD